MTKQETIRGWYREHQASFQRFAHESGSELQRLRWAKPSSSTYLVIYMIDGCCLFVTGDLGSAVYRWSSPLAFDWLANCDLSYFAGKCEASENGRQHEEWSQAKCEAEAEYRVEIWYQGDGQYVLADKLGDESFADQDWSQLSPALKRRALDYFSEIVLELDEDWSSFVSAYCGSQHEWCEFIGEHLELFDWESAGCGMETSLRCQAHLIGIQMAVAQATLAAAPLKTQTPESSSGE